MKTLTLVILAAFALQAGCARAPVDYRAAAADAEPLHEAQQQLNEVIVYEIFSPPQAARAYAYSSIAAYEAVRHGDPAYVSLAGQVNDLEPIPAPDPGVEYYLPLAGVHAFMTVGKALTFSPERMDSLRAELHERFRRMGVPRPVFKRSVEYGEQVAQHILGWAAQDYFLQLRGYPKFTVLTESGRWVPTPPAYLDAVEPNWALVRPFVMDSASQFQPKPPVPYDMSEGSPFFEQVKEVYEVTRNLSEEQRAIAHFWDNNPYKMNVRGHAMFATKKVTPGGHWMSIATIAARQADADFVRSAEAYARTAMALADGFISCWEEKFRSNLVRPETVINAYLDEHWEPELQTPPFPEYTSGHSVISAAAATVLTDLFGDGSAFVDDSEIPFGQPARSFVSFHQAADEAAISRLYGGIHYRMAIDEGLVQGRAIGEHLISRIQTRVEDARVRQAASGG
jgi:hypothetical protein